MRLLALFILSLCFACNKNVNQTVESAYLEPIIPELKYSFSRNGMSSVDIAQVNVMNNTIAYIYRTFMERANIQYPYEKESFTSYYRAGSNDIYGNRGLKPHENIAQSALHKANKTKIDVAIQSMIDSSLAISGFNNTTNVDNTGKSRRNRSVEKDSIGSRVGASLAVLGYADMRGLVVAEAWLEMLKGAVCLDKILNVHLDASVLDNPDLRDKHQNLVLAQRGGNYTELEHHLDLAYGYYYHFFSALTQTEYLIPLKGSEQQMINAFTLGRMALGKLDYEEMWQQIRIIRGLLSKVIATHIVDLLAGENTLASLHSSEPSFAFPFISRAYGMIFALQFARKPEGEPYFNYTQIDNMLQSLLKGKGLWEIDRLSGADTIKGSLKNIALQIAQPFGISVSKLR